MLHEELKQNSIMSCYCILLIVFNIHVYTELPYIWSLFCLAIEPWFNLSSFASFDQYDSRLFGHLLYK